MNDPGTQIALPAIMCFLTRSFILLATFAMFMGAVHANPKRRMRGQIQRLEQLGYKRHVARNMVLAYPQIAQEVITLAAQDKRLPRMGGDRWSYYFHGQKAYEPVTLLRGVDAELYIPNKTIRYEGYGMLGRTFLSDKHGYPLMRALWNCLSEKDTHGRKHGLMVKIQVPKYLVFGDHNPKFYRNATNTYVQGIGHPVLLQDMIPDTAPFVERIGTIPYTQSMRRKDNVDTEIIDWKPPAESARFFTADYRPTTGKVAATISRPARWLQTKQPADYLKAISAPGVHVHIANLDAR